MEDQYPINLIFITKFIKKNQYLALSTKIMKDQYFNNFNFQSKIQ